MSGLCCQQFELYGAEESISSAHGRRLEASELQDYVTAMREAPWWARNFPRVLHVEAHVRGTDAHGSVGSWQDARGAGSIEMAPRHLVELYVVHEVCHVLAEARFGSRSHDPWFAATYLQAVSTYLGSEAYVALRGAFDKAGVDYHGVEFVPAGREM